MKYLWTIIHALTATMWGSILGKLIAELVMVGELNREPDTTTRFSAGFAVFFTALLILTVASAARALIIDSREP